MTIQPEHYRVSVDVQVVKVAANNLDDLVVWLHQQGVSCGTWTQPAPALWLINDTGRAVAELDDRVVLGSHGAFVVRAADFGPPTYTPAGGA